MKKYQEEALKIAKYSILEKFGDTQLLNYSPSSTDLFEKKSCFVTLRRQEHELRGCIGTIIPIRELYLDIIDNANKAAFGDFRFESVTYDELKDLYIDITVLGPLKLLIFDSIENLYTYLENNKPGLLIELGDKSATFLPSVWKELPDSKKFLVHLLAKAGINYEDFLENFGKVKIKSYFGEEFGEYFIKI